MAKFKKGDLVRLSYCGGETPKADAKNKAHAGEIAVVDENGSCCPWITVESKHPGCPVCESGDRHCWYEDHMELVEDKPTLPENTVVHVKTEEEYNTLMRAYEAVGRGPRRGGKATEWGNWHEGINGMCFYLKHPACGWDELKTVERDGRKIISLTQALEILKKVYPKEMEGFEEVATVRIEGALTENTIKVTLPTPVRAGQVMWIKDGETESIYKTTNPLFNPTKMETLKQAIRGVSKSVRLRRKHGIEDVEGNLTRAGQEAYVQLLWEKDKESQKRMDFLLKKLDKNEDTDEE